MLCFGCTCHTVSDVVSVFVSVLCSDGTPARLLSSPAPWSSVRRRCLAKAAASASPGTAGRQQPYIYLVHKMYLDSRKCVILLQARLRPYVATTDFKSKVAVSAVTVYYVLLSAGRHCLNIGLDLSIYSTTGIVSIVLSDLCIS